MCNADSDEDGRTNGEELGDPDCQWSVGRYNIIIDLYTHRLIDWNCELLGICLLALSGAVGPKATFTHGHIFRLLHSGFNGIKFVLCSFISFRVLEILFYLIPLKKTKKGQIPNPGLIFIH